MTTTGKDNTRLDIHIFNANVIVGINHINKVFKVAKYEDALDLIRPIVDDKTYDHVTEFLYYNHKTIKLLIDNKPKKYSEGDQISLF